MKLNGKFVWQIFRDMFKKPATVPYMGGDFSLDDHVRGLLRYDKTACVACGLCMKDCPTGALSVVNEGTKEERDMHAYLDTGRCIFCGQCVDSCSRHCLACTPEANLAKFVRKDLTVEL